MVCFLYFRQKQNKRQKRYNHQVINDRKSPENEGNSFSSSSNDDDSYEEYHIDE